MKGKFLLLVLCIAATTVNAQVFKEYFTNAPTGGDLESYGNWYVSAKSSEAYGVSPKISEEVLFYTGYAGSNFGKSALLDSLVGKESSTQRISTKVVIIDNDTLRPVVGKKMYAAFMVRILPNSYTSFRDFFTWEGSTSSSFTRGRVFAKVSNANADLQFAVSKNSASSGVYVESEVMPGGVNVNHLLVLVYEAVDGDANDIITLYINPDPTKSEAEQTVVLKATDTQSDYSSGTEIKINLRQRGVGAYVGGIRVGTSWDLVLKGGATKVTDIAKRNSTISSYGKTIVTNGIGDVDVYDITGKKILSAVSDGRLQTSLKSGLYIVRFKDTKNNIVSGKVSIQ
ncbi:T9SS type A sorting domain-containing protein [Mariniphaga sediminis]|uniref:T9SS type A sorting domain-containing protein n=1 Tax=Mariniphaga sediminis TaxID=1628158 RepID=UPI00356B5B15